MQHPVVTSNAYTTWFAKGDMPLDYLRHFTVQFSVFSNQFLLAALNRVINAETIRERARVEGNPDERARCRLQQREGKEGG